MNPEYCRRYRVAHREQVAAKKRADHLAAPEKSRLRNQRWRERHAAALRAKRRAYRLAHPSEFEAYRRAYRQAHPELVSLFSATRRSRKRGAGGSHTLAEWRAVLARFGNCCAYCGRGDVVLNHDHVVPLSRGGANDIMNIVPACRSCNSKKGTKTAAEFLELGQVAA